MSRQAASWAPTIIGSRGVTRGIRGWAGLLKKSVLGAYRQTGASPLNTCGTGAAPPWRAAKARSPQEGLGGLSHRAYRELVHVCRFVGIRAKIVVNHKSPGLGQHRSSPIFAAALSGLIISLSTQGIGSASWMWRCAGNEQAYTSCALSDENFAIWGATAGPALVVGGDGKKRR